MAKQNTATNAPATNNAPAQPATVTGKYTKAIAKNAGGNPHVCPVSYAHYNHTFKRAGNAPRSTGTVMGILYNYITSQPQPPTGAQIVNWAVANGHLFAATKAKVKYAPGGKVCQYWVIGYLNGGQLPKHNHWQAVPPKGQLSQ